MLLRDVLKLDVFQDSMLVAGESSLDNNDVQLVTILEVTSDELITWIKGGELWISCLYSVSNDVDQQIHVLRLLRSRNASGLVICGIGYFFQDVSPRLIAEADAIGLPVIIMPPETTFEEILHPVMTALFNSRHYNLSVALQVQRTMNMMALRKEGIHAILHFLMEVLRKEVVFMDNENNLVCGAQDIHGELPRSFYRIPGEHDASNILYENRLLRYAVAADGYYYGSLLVLDVEQSEIEWLELILSNTLLPIILINMRKIRRFSRNELDIKNFFTTLRDGGFKDISDMFEHAERIGISLHGRHMMILIRFENSIGGEMSGEVQKLVSMEHEQNESFAFDNNVILLLASLENQEKDEDRVGKLYYSIASLLRGKTLFRMSASALYEDAAELDNVYNQTLLALAVGEKIFPDRDCVFYHDLGVYELLYTKYRLSREGAGVRREIRKLREYDEKHGGRYVDTFQALVIARENENIETIAKEVHIHKNTLLYRKNKIVELLGHDPFSMPLRFSYHAYFLAEKLGAME
ncbi:MAG: PucR family transcriptional regulator ligand-binding domain-containing protein [Treponema sp.]|nr:PucR family transcriptional regulator ligand-binding domain-containing protein [Treponema sp.]